MSRVSSIAELAGRLHGDRDAALAAAFGFILLFFAWGMAATLNTGQVAYDKIRVQNAADAIALAHAEQAARDLNVMSMNNTGLTQMLVVSAVSFTLAETIADIEARAALAQLQIARSAVRCGPNKFCLAAHAAAAAQVASVQIAAAAIFARYRPDRGFSTSQRLIDAFNRMNDFLVRSFPRRSGELVRLLLDENGADAVFVYPPCSSGGGSECRGGLNEGGDLPVSRQGMGALAAYREVCVGAEQGSDGQGRTDFLAHGYPQGRGPYTAGGSSSNPHLRDHVNRQSGLSALLPFFGEATLKGWDWLIGFSTPPKYRDRQRGSENDFTTKMNRNWSIVCNPAGGLVANIAGSILRLPQPYWLNGRPAVASALPSSLGAAAQDMEELQYLVFVAQDRGLRVNPEDFRERDDPYHAYAQAMVYNTQSYDLFTSKWKAKLVPASFMDRPDPVAAAMRTRSGSGMFDLVVRIIEAERSNPEWSHVNTH